eukprot:252673-Chlamydomonas_euryale.AAC.1
MSPAAAQPRALDARARPAAARRRGAGAAAAGSHVGRHGRDVPRHVPAAAENVPAARDGVPGGTRGRRAACDAPPPRDQLCERRVAHGCVAGGVAWTDVWRVGSPRPICGGWGCLDRGGVDNHAWQITERRSPFATNVLPSHCASLSPTAPNICTVRRADH